MKKTTTISSTTITDTDRVTIRNQNETGCFPKRIVGACLAVLMTATVFFFGAASSWAAMFLASALFFIFCFFLKLFSDFSPNFVRLFIFGLLFLIFHSLFFSRNRYASFGEILQCLSLLCFFILVWKLPPASIDKLSLLLVFIGVFETIYGVGEVYSGHEHVLWVAKKNHTGFVTGTYFNRNHLAGLLELCLGLAAGGFMKSFYRKEKFMMVILAGAFFVLIAGLFLSGSRMGVLSFAFALALVGMVGLFQKKRKTSCAAGFILLLAGIPALLLGMHPWLSRWAELPFLSADGQRLRVWKDTLHIIHDYPLTGIGLGAFELVFPKYQSPELVMAWSHAHNGYLELMAELGLPGFVLLSGAFIFFFKYCLGGTRHLDVGLFWFQSGLMIGILAFLIHGLTDFNFSVPANMLVFTFLLVCLFNMRMSRT